MPLRKYQIAKKAVDKTKLDDDAQVKIQTQLVHSRGTVGAIIGNAGTTYAAAPASDIYFRPDDYKNILSVTLVAIWDPRTTAGGLRPWNTTDEEPIAYLEPGVAGERYDRVDVTDKFKGYVGEKRLLLCSKGDGATAPEYDAVYYEIVVSNVP